MRGAEQAEEAKEEPAERVRPDTADGPLPALELLLGDGDVLLKLDHGSGSTATALGVRHEDVTIAGGHEACEAGVGGVGG